MTTTTRVSAREVVIRANYRARDVGKQWGTSHWKAWTTSTASEPIVKLVEGFAGMADRHYDIFDTVIGRDGVLGPAWASIGKGIIMLLNGQVGTLDPATVDHMVRSIFLYNGLTVEGERV